jgi:hypothetical protein
MAFVGWTLRKPVRAFRHQFLGTRRCKTMAALTARVVPPTANRAAARARQYCG